MHFKDKLWELQSLECQGLSENGQSLRPDEQLRILRKTMRQKNGWPNLYQISSPTLTLECLSLNKKKRKLSLKIKAMMNKRLVKRIHKLKHPTLAFGTQSSRSDRGWRWSRID